VPSLGDFPPPVLSGQIRDIQGHYAGGFYSAWFGFTAVAALPYRLAADLHEARDSALEQIQQDMVDYAKENAPWNDVTGDARAELNSPPIIENSDGSKTLILAHGVDYGIYLETRDGGSLGIIPQTIDHFAAMFPGAVKSKLPSV
jgi:hypothetical protein